jgi:hypothetical protein
MHGGCQEFPEGDHSPRCGADNHFPGRVFTSSAVATGLPAMVVNDGACGLVKRGVLESIDSKRAQVVRLQGALI